MHDNIMIPDPREAKLPVWARDMLLSARRRVRNAELGEQAAKLATDPHGSDMIIDRYDDMPIGLGKRPTVRAVLARKENGDVTQYIDMRMSEDRKSVELMGNTTLNIRPQVTNVISVTTNYADH